MALSVDRTSGATLKHHLVQFYEAEDSLLSAMSAFVGGGLKVGDACVVLSTKQHHEDLLKRLERDGLDVPAALAQEDYIWADATEMLSGFLVAGMPDPERFAEIVEGTIARAGRNQRNVRIFREIVALPSSQGDHAATLCLEELWNSLYLRFPAISLYCAYPTQIFGGQVSGREFLKICQQHSHIIPADAYSLHTTLDEQLQTISLLQQQANTFEAELAQGKEVEGRLRRSEEASYRLAAIVESSDDAIVSKTLDGIITSWNAAAERLFGYSSEEAVGKHITLIIPPELYSEEEEIISKLRRGIRIEHFETVRMR
ncbi:MAG TPA: MEDS domain-containing protein, partial [Ktedonobacteraceae bacterium]